MKFWDIRKSAFDKILSLLKKLTNSHTEMLKTRHDKKFWWLTKAYEAIEEYMPQYKEAKEPGAYIKERISKAHARTVPMNRF